MVQELNGLMAREEMGQKVERQSGNNLTKVELLQFSPILADRLGAKASDGLDTVAAQIAGVVVAPGSDSPSAKELSLVRLTQNLIDAHASGDAMFEFLKDKPQMMDCIAGWDGHKQIVAVQVPGSGHKGFLCWTDGREDAYLVILGPTTNPLFDAANKPGAKSWTV